MAGSYIHRTQCLVLLLAAFATDASHAQSGKPIAPETIVVFPQSGIVCLTKEQLQEITMHSLRGERTKANAMTYSDYNPDGPCTMLSPKLKYKVLSVEYNDPNHPKLGLLEIVGAKSKADKGGWAFSIGAQPSRK